MRKPISKTQTLDDNTFASNPGLITLSHSKLRCLQPNLYPSKLRKFLNPNIEKNIQFWLTHIEEHLSNGDSRAAIVVSVEPPLVAAYTDELDCVVLLEFDYHAAAAIDFKMGTRLLTVNTYASREEGVASDLKIGSEDLGNWGNFAPFIAEFFSDDMARIQARKAEISEDEWKRTEVMGMEALRSGVAPRSGRPLLCMKTAAEIFG